MNKGRRNFAVAAAARLPRLPSSARRRAPPTMPPMPRSWSRTRRRRSTISRATRTFRPSGRRSPRPRQYWLSGDPGRRASSSAVREAPACCWCATTRPATGSARPSTRWARLQPRLPGRFFGRRGGDDRQFAEGARFAVTTKVKLGGDASVAVGPRESVPCALAGLRTSSSPRPTRARSPGWRSTALVIEIRDLAEQGLLRQGAPAGRHPGQEGRDQRGFGRIEDGSEEGGEMRPLPRRAPGVLAVAALAAALAAPALALGPQDGLKTRRGLHFNSEDYGADEGAGHGGAQGRERRRDTNLEERKDRRVRLRSCP